MEVRRYPEHAQRAVSLIDLALRYAPFRSETFQSVKTSDWHSIGTVATWITEYHSGARALVIFDGGFRVLEVTIESVERCDERVEFGELLGGRYFKLLPRVVSELEQVVPPASRVPANSTLVPA